MRHFARTLLITVLSAFLPVLLLIARAQTLDCSDTVKTALATTGDKCSGITRNKACYGNVLAAASANDGVDPAKFIFQNPADQVAVSDVGSLRLAALDPNAKQWGVAYLRIQANLPDTAVGQYVTMLLFGDSQLQNAAKTASTTDTSYQPMQAVYLKTGVGSPVCHNAPTSGMIIQSPGGKQKVNLLVDGVQLSIGSTVLLQMDSDDLTPLAKPSAASTSTPPPTNTPRSPTKTTPLAPAPMKLVITTIEGDVRVTTGGLTRLARTGQQITVSMNDSVNDNAADTPNDTLSPVGLPSSPVYVNIRPLLTLYIGALIGRNLINPTDAPVYVAPPYVPPTLTRTATAAPPQPPPPAAATQTPVPSATIALTPTSTPQPPVTNLNDAGAGSLRAALSAAPPGGTIDFQSGLTGTLLLASGELSIAQNVTINGPGAALITINNATGRVFNVNQSVTASITGLTLTGYNIAGSGGAIVNAGTLSVSFCLFTGDFAGAQGGAVYNTGTLHLNNVQIDNPGAEIGAPGVFNGGTLTMNNSTINGTQGGDAIDSSGTATIINSTIYGVQGTAVNVSGGTLTLLADTLAGAGNVGVNVSGGAVSIQNTIVAQNPMGDIAGAVTSLGYNLIDDNSGGTLASTDRRNTPAGLMTPPAANGGFTQTIALAVSSPAVDAIPLPNCAVAADERGTTRPQGSACDIGAFE